MILIENMARAIGAALAQIEPGVRVGYLSDGEHEELAMRKVQMTAFEREKSHAGERDGRTYERCSLRFVVPDCSCHERDDHDGAVFEESSG